MCLPKNPKAGSECNPPKLDRASRQTPNGKNVLCSEDLCYSEDSHSYNEVLSGASQTVLYIASSFVPNSVLNPVHLYRHLAYDYSREEISLILLK